MRQLVGMFVAVGLLATAASLVAQRGSSSAIRKGSTADDFATLDAAVQLGPPATVDEWTQQLRTWGFKRIDDLSSSGLWEKTDSEGVLRANAFYLPDKVSVWLVFFPTSHVPMADAVLNQLMRNPDSTTINAGVEIGLTTPLSETGSRAEFALIVHSTVTRRRVVVEWRR
jgi:hypothetical protein